jgi:hypothetical protein
VPPTVIDAFSVLDSGGSGPGGITVPTNQYVDVIFSKAMDLTTLLNPANYTIAGATVTGVTVFTNNNGVAQTTQAILQLAAPLKGTFTVTLNGVTDVSGVAPSNPSVSGAVDPLTSEDIGLIALPGTTYYMGPGSYEVAASGIDIWGTQDSFRYVYETRTNNFDVVVQVPYIAPADQWTKAGLMARESIDPADGGSRMMFAIATASTTLSPKPLDASTAQNAYSTGIRSETDTGAYSGTKTGQYFFVGDGVVPVPFPNVWIRMTRTGFGTTNDTFSGYASTDGQTWGSPYCSYNPEATTNSDGTTPTAFPAVTYIGMCTTAHLGATATQFYGDAQYQNFGDYVAKVVTAQPVLTAKLASPTTVTVSWTPSGGTLYSSSTLTTNSSSWSAVGTANPATVTIGAGSTYFEIRQ